MTQGSEILSGSDTQALARRVRPAQLDRPLQRSSPDRHYTDPKLEELIRTTTARASEAGRAQGYLVGWTQGQRSAAQESAALQQSLRKEHEQLCADLKLEAQELLTNLRETIVQVQDSMLPEWNEIADLLVDGAMRLARAALGRELQSVDDRVTLDMQNALRQVAASKATVVHLNPADAEEVAEDLPKGLTVVADPSVDVGGVVVATPTQRFRRDLPAAMAAAEEVLRS